MLKQHESKNRQWFAIDGGTLKPLGDCGCFEAADEIATDLGMELNWIVSPEMAQEWVNVLASKGIIGEPA